MSAIKTLVKSNRSISPNGLLPLGKHTQGTDSYDESWDGVTVAMPLANNLHQELVQLLCFVFQSLYGLNAGHRINPGVNVSDRVEGWQQNYRIPDVAFFMKATNSIDCGTHWCGGPDFLVEIISSAGDPAREKLPFYASVNSREVLIIDREPWQLELYQIHDGIVGAASTSTVSQPDVLTSSVLPVSFRMVDGPMRPKIEVVHTATGANWRI